MKKIMKIGALSLAIVASLFLLSNTTKAATAEVQLRITGTAGSCVYGTVMNAWSTWFSFSAQSLSWGFTGTSAPDGKTRRCFDSSGTASWNLAMQMSGDLMNMSNSSYRINSGQVSYANFAVHQMVGSGTCTAVQGASTSITDRKALNGSRKVLEKTSAVGEVCRVQTTGLNLKIDIPAAQNIGLYSGQVTITLPTF